MKKIFSAFLLMTMMVFSVGSFVACSDLENEIAAVDQQATENAAAIADLNSKLTSLQTALTAAQADADAAMDAAKAAKEAGDAAKAEAEAAKAAASQAKADAIAAAAEQIEALKAELEKAIDGKASAEDVEAIKTEISQINYAITNINGSVEKHEAAIEDLQTELDVLKATLANYEKNLKELDLLTDELSAAISYNLEAITNLQGTVQTQQMDIDDLKVAVEDLVAQVETLNSGLVAIYDILGVLATQVQSVVFVPEYNNAEIEAERFVAGNNELFTNYLAVATYEVRPAKLAEALTSENLSFAGVLTTTKAAAAPEYFKAHLIDADAATGRIVVAAVINDNDGKKTASIYDQLKSGKAALSLNIASVDVTELLIAREEVAVADMVSSSYNFVTSTVDTRLAESFGFPVVEKGVKKTSTTFTDEITVAWDKSAESETALFDTELCVLVQDQFLSLADASEVLGVEFDAKYALTAAYNDATDAIKKDEYNPFTVTGKDLTATASFANTDSKVKDAALAGYNAVVNVVATVSAGDYTFVTKRTATTTYKIGNKKSDFEFADAKKVDWKYDDKDFARAIDQELAVEGFDNIKADGVKVNDDFKTTVYAGTENEYNVSAEVKVLSSKAVQVKIAEGKLPYAQGEDAVYEFKGTVTYQNVDYTVIFNVTLGAMPEDKVIDLGTLNAVANTTADMTVKNINPVLQIRESISAVDADFAKLAHAALNAEIKHTAAKTDGVLVNDKEAKAGDKGYATFTLLADTKDKALVDASYITVNEVADYTNTIQVTETYTVCGVVYTVKATVVTGKPEFTFEPAVAYVNADNQVILDGTVKFDYADAKKLATAGTGDPYALNSINLRNYVNVEIPKDYVGDYQLRYTLKTTLQNEKGEWLTIPGTKDEYDHTCLPQLPGKKIFDSHYTAIDGTCPLDWNTDMREMVYEIALVSNTKIKDADGKDVDNVFASFEVTLVAPEVLTFTASEEALVVKCLNGKVQGSTNVVYALNVTDKFGNVAYNPYATTLDDIWNGYKVTVDANGNVTAREIKDANFFNRYEQDLTVPAGDVKAYIGTTDVTKQVNPSVDAKGNVTLQPETGTIQGDVVVEVPVKLTYLFDEYGVLAQTAVVKVLFTANADAVETPGGDVTYDTPEGKQWIFDNGWNPLGFETTGLYDLGNAKIAFSAEDYVYDANGDKVANPNEDPLDQWDDYLRKTYTTEYTEYGTIAFFNKDEFKHPATGDVKFPKESWLTNMYPCKFTVKAKDATSGIIEVRCFEPKYDEDQKLVLDSKNNIVLTPILDIDGKERVDVINYSEYTGSTVTITEENYTYKCRVPETPITETVQYVTLY